MLRNLTSRLAALRAAPAPVNELLENVDDLREQIESLSAERSAIEAAPRPLSETLDLLDKHLDDIATQAVDDLNLHHLRQRGASFRINFSQSGTHAVEVRNLLGLMIALDRKKIRAMIADQLRDLEGSRPGVTDADRVTRLAQLDAALLAAELAEEKNIRSLEVSGVEILRRPDVDPRAVLAADAALAVF